MMLEGRDRLVERFRDLFDHYTPALGDATTLPQTWDVELTPDAWERYNKFEIDMLEIGVDSSMAELMTPMMQRLTTSGLKAAVLIAASQRLSDRVVVQVSDLIKAFSYVESWKSHAIAVVANAGKTPNEKLMERIYKTILEAAEQGMPRSLLMQQYRLDARAANNIFETLDQRGLIRTSKDKGTTYHPTRIVTVKG